AASRCGCPPHARTSATSTPTTPSCRTWPQASTAGSGTRTARPRTRGPGSPLSPARSGTPPGIGTRAGTAGTSQDASAVPLPRMRSGRRRSDRPRLRGQRRHPHHLRAHVRARRPPDPDRHRPRRPPVSLHENDQTVSYIPLSGDPTIGSVRGAEEAVKAFKTALRELGEYVPANDVRAVLTTSGLRLEVTAAPATTTEHHGTPAPADEIAELIGDAPQAETLFDEPAPFEVGDKVRITGDTQEWEHERAPGTEGVVVQVLTDDALVATSLARTEWGEGPDDARYVHFADLEHA